MSLPAREEEGLAWKHLASSSQTWVYVWIQDWSTQEQTKPSACFCSHTHAPPPQRQFWELNPSVASVGRHSVVQTEEALLSVLLGRFPWWFFSFPPPDLKKHGVCSPAFFPDRALQRLNFLLFWFLPFCKFFLLPKPGSHRPFWLKLLMKAVWLLGASPESSFLTKLAFSLCTGPYFLKSQSLTSFTYQARRKMEKQGESLSRKRTIQCLPPNPQVVPPSVGSWGFGWKLHLSIPHAWCYDSVSWTPSRV